MSSFTRFQLFFTVLVLITQIAAHSYMTSPTSRSNQAQSQTGCRGPTCLGPCDIPLSKATRAPIVAARGDKIVVDWPRNNHAGGFIRFAWAPTALSDSHAAFDSHVQQINCHEIGNPTPGQCAPADPINDPNGGGSGPGDGSSGACTTTITVPVDLTDGKWTLQWAWFGGAFSLGDYFSCADYVISGGKSIGVMTPVFIGGDFTYPNQQKCKFFNTDKLHVCTNEPCQAPIYSGAQSGPPAAGQLGLSVVVATPVPNANPSTTASVPRPSTTAATKPSTTAAPVVVPTPTPVVKPSTTGRPQSMTTGLPVVVPPVVVPSASCAGSLSASTSTASIVSIDSWGPQFHVLVRIKVSEAMLSNWVLQIVWPTEAASVDVLRYFNAGTLQCEDSSASYFKPSAAWSNNLVAGSEMDVEFIASNPDNLNVNFLQAAIRLNMLKN